MYSHTSKAENLLENKLSFSTELKNRGSVRLGKIKKITLKKHFHFGIFYLRFYYWQLKIVESFKNSYVHPKQWLSCNKILNSSSHSTA